MPTGSIRQSAWAGYCWFHGWSWAVAKPDPGKFRSEKNEYSLSDKKHRFQEKPSPPGRHNFEIENVQTREWTLGLSTSSQRAETPVIQGWLPFPAEEEHPVHCWIWSSIQVRRPYPGDGLPQEACEHVWPAAQSDGLWAAARGFVELWSHQGRGLFPLDTDHACGSPYRACADVVFCCQSQWRRNQIHRIRHQQQSSSFGESMKTMLKTATMLHRGTAWECSSTAKASFDSTTKRRGSCRVQGKHRSQAQNIIKTIQNRQTWPSAWICSNLACRAFLAWEM